MRRGRDERAVRLVPEDHVGGGDRAIGRGRRAVHEGEGHRHVLGRVRPGDGDVVAAQVAAFQSDLHRVRSRGHIGDREGPIEGRRRRRAEGELLVRKADRGTAGADIARSERPVVIEVVVGGSLDGVRRNLQVPRHDPIGQAVPVEVRGGAHRLVHAHMERRAREGAAPDERGPRRGPDRGRDRDVSEGNEGAVMSVRIRRREVVRRPEFVRDRDADPGEWGRSGGHRAVHPRAVIVPQEHDAIPHARDRGEVHEPLRLPRGDVLLEAARLVVVHRLIGIRVVPRIGEWIVVRGPVDDAEVGEVPRRRGRERLQGLSEARDPGLVRQPDVRRRVADVRPVEHRLVERRQVILQRGRSQLATRHGIGDLAVQLYGSVRLLGRACRILSVPGRPLHRPCRRLCVGCAVAISSRRSHSKS